MYSLFYSLHQIPTLLYHLHYSLYSSPCTPFPDVLHFYSLHQCPTLCFGTFPGHYCQSGTPIRAVLASRIYAQSPMYFPSQLYSSRKVSRLLAPIPTRDVLFFSLHQCAANLLPSSLLSSMLSPTLYSPPSGICHPNICRVPNVPPLPTVLTSKCQSPRSKTHS